MSNRGAHVLDQAPRRQLPLQPPTREQVDGEAGRRYRRRLEATSRADEVHLVARMAARHELLGERERGEHVAAGAAAADQCVRLRHRRAADGREPDRGGAGRPWRATFTRMPVASMVVMSAEPPNDTNGSGMPVTGSRADDRADVDHRLADDPHRGAGGDERTEPVGRAQRGARAEDAERDEQPDHEEAPDEPELLADDGEDEVGVRVGQEVPLRPAGAEADAGQAAAPERDERLRDLVAGVGRVGERVQEREHARPPVGLGEREQRDRGVREGADHGQVRLAHPAGDEHRDTTSASTMAEPRSGSFITRSVNPPSTRTTGLAHPPPVAQLAGSPAHEVGGVQEQRELGDLARLEPEHPGAEPAARTRDVDADAGDEHDAEQHAALTISSGRTSSRHLR